MLLWLIYSVRDFMELVCICSACFERALRVLVQDSKGCLCWQCVRAVGEARPAEAGFLCEGHQGQCRGGTEADDQADKAHRSQVSIPGGVGEKRGRAVK